MTAGDSVETTRAFAEFGAAVREFDRLGLEWELDPTHERFVEVTASMRAVFRPAAVVAQALGEHHRTARLWRQLAEMNHVSVLSMWSTLIGHMDTLLLRDGEVGL